MRLFANRSEAAKELSAQLAYLKSDNPLVLGVPNYGVPIAAIIADSLEAPLDILLIAKLSMPDQPLQIVGAVDEHGRISMIQSAARLYHVTAQQMIAPLAWRSRTCSGAVLDSGQSCRKPRCADEP